ncbi:MAG: response regulator [Ectothiorhodospiraceae bacterium]|jgi:response regulator NasT
MSEGRILLVDDDRLVLATLGAGLRQAGFEVDEAACGENAMDIVERHPPDLAVVDVRMPGMSGASLASWLSEHTDVPFIFLSAYSEPDIVQSVVACGALTYLVKPIQVEQLIPAVKAALQRADDIHQLRENRDQLDRALRGSRSVNVAVGLLMAAGGVGREDAFERIQRFARSRRRKVEEVSAELIAASETIGDVLGERPPLGR